MSVDIGGSLSTYAPWQTGGVVAASASLAAAAFLVSHVRRHAVRRRTSAAGRPPASSWELPTSAGLLLSGTYRGRTVEMAFASDRRLSVTARLVNYRHLFAEFGSGDPLPRAAWLNPACHRKLALLGEGWSVAVRDRFLLLSVPGVDGEPEWQRHLLDLTCDLSDAVDAA